MDLLDILIFNKLKNKKGGGSGSKLNLFVQNSQPQGFNGIWIKSNDFEYSKVIEVENDSSLVASSINIVKGNKFETIMIDSNVENGLHYNFGKILLTDSLSNVITNEKVYYGNGLTWVDISYLAIYEDIEYINVKSNQYIRTDFIPSDKSKFEISAEFNEVYSGTQTFLCGTGYSADILQGNSRFNVGTQSNSRFYFGVGNKDENKATDTQLGKHLFFIDLKNSSFGWDDNIYTDTILFNNQNDIPFLLMGRLNGDNTINGNGNFKFYSCKLYENEELFHDMIPVIRFTDKKVCVYDKITKTFLLNDGSGEFEDE